MIKPLLAGAASWVVLSLAVFATRGDTGVTNREVHPKIAGTDLSQRAVTNSILADGDRSSLTVSSAASNLTSANAALETINPCANLNTIYSFVGPLSALLRGGKGGYEPEDGLVIGNDGSLYGVTAKSGDAISGTDVDTGTVFRITPNGALTTLCAFAVDSTAIELGILAEGTIFGGTPKAALAQGPDGNFYGTTTEGSRYFPNHEDQTFGGTIFCLTPTGTLTMLNCFETETYVTGRLVVGRDGCFYGTTAGSDHIENRGTVFKVSASGEITTLHTFTGGKDGSNPESGLVQGKDGYFYGTTAGGNGTVFRLDNQGILTTLYSFTGGADGGAPRTKLVEVRTGVFYGTTSKGGVGGTNGTLFQFTSTGELTMLYPFTGGNDGSQPNELAWGNDGALYGTTQFGGPYGLGTVYKITTNGAFTLLNWFTDPNNATDHPNLPSRLVRGQDGTFYGTTSAGGVFGAGTVFQVLLATNAPFFFTPPQDQVVLPGNTAYFTVSVGGLLPLTYRWQKDTMTLVDGGRVSGARSSCLVISDVIPADAGTYRLMVDNQLGSVTSTGSVLEVILPEPPMQVLYSFELEDVHGYLPIGGVTLDHQGNLYGTTLWDAGWNGGTIFRLPPNGVLSTLYSFGTLTNENGEALDGCHPMAPLVQGKDGAFYGTTQSGGQYGLGVVFKLTSAGTLTTLASLNGTNGVAPVAGLTLGNDGNFYGTTEAGGASLALDTDGSFIGYGTVFKATPSGQLTTLISFNGTNGATPYGGLTLGNDGNFYGSTLAGGSSFKLGGDPQLSTLGTYGTIFKMTPRGELTTLVSFGGTNGVGPQGTLALGMDDEFYGAVMAIMGDRTITHGALFRVTSQGTLTLLHSFSGGTDGSSPQGGLMRGMDGNFYGTTISGGEYDAGIAFRMTPTGIFTPLCSFTGGIDGRAPMSGLIQGPDGCFYGSTSSGGTGRGGTIYKLTLNNATPTLNITGTKAQVILTWPDTASEFILETSDRLGPYAHWIPWTMGFSLSSGFCILTNQVNSPSGFFRLRKP
jgi:uncharacterized repeat protein (TIGR03803 family)